MALKKQNTSLRVAIVVTIITAILFSFLFLYLGINHRRDVYNDSKVLATEISRKAAFETQVYILSAILKARSLEQQAQLIYKLNGSREDIRSMIKHAILENKNYLATWTMWEPDAFDGKDSIFRTDSLYNNQGSIGMAYFRYEDSIFYEIMNPKEYVNEYYAYPKSLKSEYLTKPYYYRYSGYEQLFFGSTVTVPIIIEDEFVGAIGIDIDLERLQKQLSRIKPYETGYLSLISDNGTIVTHGDTAFVGENMKRLLDEADTLSYHSITHAKELTFETKSEFTGEKVFRMFYPIIIAEGNQPWSMMIEIPVEKATYRSKQLLIVAIITLLVGLSLLIYLVINIAERKRYERDLLQAKFKAEESDRLKSAFLNNLSHEIRTPLNGILGFTELLVDERTEAKDAESYTSIIRSSSKQLLSIISNVIELSKIQSGRSKLEVKKFDVERSIQTVIDTFRTEAEEKGLDFITNYSKKDIARRISTDEDKFKQVLSYLIHNAIKFTKKGTIEVGYDEKKDYFQFYVKDTGIGIKEENLKNIFGSFNQGDATSIRKYGGLGIGLSISKSFIDMLKGEIWLESEEGKGSTFYFTLPRAKNRDPIA